MRGQDQVQYTIHFARTRNIKKIELSEMETPKLMGSEAGLRTDLQELTKAQQTRPKWLRKILSMRQRH